MYLAFNAPHTPLQATKEDYAKLPQIKDKKTRVYGAMIAQLDRRIGDVMAQLKRAGIDDNTLVIFTSDNGGAWYNGMPDLNAPYRGWQEIGRANVCTPVTNAHIVCRLLLEKK